MRTNDLIVIIAVVVMLFGLFSKANAQSSREFSPYEKQVAAESIVWSKDNAIEEFTEIQMNYMKDKILNSNFHASLGLGTYGSLLDFITALSKIYPVNGIGIEITNYKKAIEAPYSVAHPLVSAHCTLQVVYKPFGGASLAYSFKFLYYSDAERLKKLAEENKFPRPESMDDKTTLIMIKEFVTDNYPDEFKPMDQASFNHLLSTPIEVLKDYIAIKK